MGFHPAVNKILHSIFFLFWYWCFSFSLSFIFYILIRYLTLITLLIYFDLSIGTVFSRLTRSCLCDIQFIFKLFFPHSLCVYQSYYAGWMSLCCQFSLFCFFPPIHQMISARLKRNSLPWCWATTSSVKTSTPRKISTSIYMEVSHLWWKLLTSITEPPPKSSLMKTSNPIPPPPPQK